MPAGIIYFLLILFVIGIVALTIWTPIRGDQIVDAWAKDRQYQLVGKYRVFFSLNRFVLESSRSQLVYHFTVVDRKGVKRSGLLRCGGWWSGIFSDEVTVKWDD